MTTFAIAVLIIGAAGVFVFMKKNRRNKQPSDPVVPASVQPPKENEYEDILNALLKLNIMIRKDKDFHQDLLDKIETIMDDLMVVIPSMMEHYPSETLTYEVKKIGKSHLFKTVKEFLDLSAESRENQVQLFEQTIASLHEVCNRSRQIVEKNETAEFKTMANFLSGKFS